MGELVNLTRILPRSSSHDSSFHQIIAATHMDEMQICYSGIMMCVFIKYLLLKIHKAQIIHLQNEIRTRPPNLCQ